MIALPKIIFENKKSNEIKNLMQKVLVFEKKKKMLGSENNLKKTKKLKKL